MLITVEPLERNCATTGRFLNFLAYSTLPLGWEAGAYAYHTTGLFATSYIIILGVHPSTSLIVVQARLWCTRS